MQFSRFPTTPPPPSSYESPRTFIFHQPPVPLHNSTTTPMVPIAPIKYPTTETPVGYGSGYGSGSAPPPVQSSIPLRKIINVDLPPPQAVRPPPTVSTGVSKEEKNKKKIIHFSQPHHKKPVNKKVEINTTPVPIVPDPIPDPPSTPTEKQEETLVIEATPCTEPAVKEPGTSTSIPPSIPHLPSTVTKKTFEDQSEFVAIFNPAYSRLHSPGIYVNCRQPETIETKTFPVLLPSPNPNTFFSKPEMNGSGSAALMNVNGEYIFQNNKDVISVNLQTIDDLHVTPHSGCFIVTITSVPVESEDEGTHEWYLSTMGFVTPKGTIRFGPTNQQRISNQGISVLVSQSKPFTFHIRKDKGWNITSYSPDQSTTRIETVIPASHHIPMRFRYSIWMLTDGWRSITKIRRKKSKA